MTTTRPELGLERLLAALGQDLLDASDEEILAVADELGQKPTMKGSIALLGVTFAFRRKDQHEQSAHKAKKSSAGAGSIRRSRRRAKGDAPSST
jgi:hypothetical protein